VKGSDGHEFTAEDIRQVTRHLAEKLELAGTSPSDIMERLGLVSKF